MQELDITVKTDDNILSDSDERATIVGLIYGTNSESKPNTQEIDVSGHSIHGESVQFKTMVK